VTQSSAVEPDRARTAQTGFVPVSLQDTLALRAGADLGRRSGCAATVTLLGELGGQTSIEEAEFAALSYAGVLAVLISSSARRLVLAAELGPDQVTDHGSPFGEISIVGLSWPQIQAIFVDEPRASEAVTSARRALSHGQGGRTLAAALDIPEVGELLDGFDLLWFAPEELDQLGEDDDLTRIAGDRAD
jgi:hypothetical protein